MEKVTVEDLKKIYLPPKESHKGENGKLMIVGGSKLFHGASLWALKVASRIVDMVFYASIPENNELTKKLKTEIFDFIAVPREEVENYIEESEAILIGPGLTRAESGKARNSAFLRNRRVESGEVDWENTRQITEYFLKKFPAKKWIIDAGSLQMMEPEWLNKNCLITPHEKEFKTLFKMEATGENIRKMAEKYDCMILLKGPTDIICSSTECKISEGGNPGMTKGGTGDVLAGLVAALSCKNDLFLAACAASFINKRAGEELFGKVGDYFNASDLTDQIPQTMKKYVLA